MQIRVNSTDDINVDDIVEFKVMNEEMEISNHSGTVISITDSGKAFILTKFPKTKQWCVSLKNITHIKGGE